MQSNRLKDYFTPSRRFSNKLPAIYLDSVRTTDDLHHIEIFLVNASDQTLEFVASPKPLLFISSLAVCHVEDDILHYEDVVPGEAVKVAEFDEIFDSDFLHQLTLIWQQPEGDARHVAITGKGMSKFTYRVLEWREE